MGRMDQEKDNERENARAELIKALRRVVEAELGEGASFAERERAALAAYDEALAEVSAAVVLSRDELPVPTQQGVGCDDVTDNCENMAARC